MSLCGIPRSAAICTLAQTLYQTWVRFYSLDQPAWHTLSTRDRIEWMQRASQQIDDLAPRARVITFRMEVP